MSDSQPSWIPDGSDPADWVHAIEAAASDTGTAAAPSMPCAPITVGDVAQVVKYAISYEGVAWQPGNRCGTGLELTAVLRLTDGRWASLQGWNDYTGWGCRDGATVRIGPDEPSVIWYGLTAQGRQDLNLTTRQAPASADAVITPELG